MTAQRLACRHRGRRTGPYDGQDRILHARRELPEPFSPDQTETPGKWPCPRPGKPRPSRQYGITACRKPCSTGLRRSRWAERRTARDGRAGAAPGEKAPLLLHRSWSCSRRGWPGGGGRGNGRGAGSDMPVPLFLWPASPGSGEALRGPGRQDGLGCCSRGFRPPPQGLKRGNPEDLPGGLRAARPGETCQQRSDWRSVSFPGWGSRLPGPPGGAGGTLQGGPRGGPGLALRALGLVAAATPASGIVSTAGDLGHR